MVTTNQVDSLLEADSENATKTRLALEELFPDAMETANAGAALFELLSWKWGEVCEYDKHQATVEKWADGFGLAGEEALQLLSQAVLIGRGEPDDLSAAAKASLSQAVAIVARGFIMVRIARDYLFGITDLLRLRITSSIGYIRLQAESTGLLKLMAVQPEAAQAWLDSMFKNEGKSFYFAWQKRIKAQIKDLGIAEDYDTASEHALHARPWGVSRGILIGMKKKQAGRIEMVYQEGDEPILLLFAFTRFIEFHRRLCEKAHDIYPELMAVRPRISELDRFFELSDRLVKRVKEVRQSIGQNGVIDLLLKKKS